MSTLFFDGFDRGTLLKRLDPNYWKLQLRNYPQYAFGGYSYSHTAVTGGAYSSTFDAYSPNGGILPLDNYIGYDPFGFSRGTPNNYPAYGKSPGFLALSNIPINQSAFNLTPLSYVALTGFPSISGTKSYFGLRCLGIETKDIDYYDSDSLIEGRYGSSHPFLAFCSGNITGLLLSFVRVTGDTLLNLRQAGDSTQTYTGQKITIGLEVQQNNGTSGIFDLNVGDTLANYRITPIYCGPTPDSGPSLIPLGNPHKILTIADTDLGTFNTNVMSRWTHFEFEIDHTGGSVRLKVEDADALVINNEEEDRELWDISIDISGFYYDNIRIFNRTYNSSALSACTGNPTYSGLNNAYYYRLGSLTLIDDVTLIDNTGNNPRYFLGKDSKVLPLNPGFGSNNGTIFSDQENGIDGPLQWLKSKNISNKALLASFDKDDSYIYTSEPNELTAIVYSNSYYNVFANTDPLSSWRYSYNDGIAGMKLYNYARKQFLDTNFRNIISRTGAPDPYSNNTIFLIHANETNPIIDYSTYNHSFTAIGDISLVNSGKFDGALSFSNSNSLLVATNSFFDIRQKEFTAEAWIKFDSVNDTIVLFDRKYRDNLVAFPLNGSEVPDYNNSVKNLGYRFSVNTGCLRIESWYEVVLPPYSDSSPCPTPAVMDLTLPSSISTGTWHHIAVTRTIMNTDPGSGYFTVFLNGVSGTGYNAYNIYNGYNYVYDNCPSYGTDSSSSGAKIFEISGGGGAMYYSNGYGMHFGNLTSLYIPNNSNTAYPIPYTYFGGSGNIDELRISSGLVRYSSNFTPSSVPYIGPLERFIEFGPVHELNRTNYRLIQYYQMNHPENNEPFTSGQIIPSGIKLGVKKL